VVGPSGPNLGSLHFSPSQHPLLLHWLDHLPQEVAKTIAVAHLH
jgi:hypothetical protein